MISRRHCVTAGLILVATGSGWLLPRGANAQAADKASAFVQQTGDRLVAIVNGPMAAAEKRRALAQILDTTVDVDAVARFCLGRFWRVATPDQQKRFIQEFHEVLVTNISSKLGEYKGVKLTVQRARPQEDEAVVTTVVERPNNPQTTVDWIIGQPATTPKIVDVVAEGTSLRLTQRQDYASFLTRNNNNIDALISAMKQQTAQNG
jgi:phospholipid transport system substrate-binding protein